MLISIGSPHGSCGATTFASLFARYWPGDGSPRFLLEADADGGVLAARWHETLAVSWTPGVVELAGSTRGGASMIQALDDGGQPVGGGVELVAGLPSRTAMAAALRGLADDGLAELARSDRLVVADVGRLRDASLGLVRRSQLTVLVCRPDLESAQLVRPIIGELRAVGAEVCVVAVGNAPYRSDEFADAVRVPDVWSVPDDHRGAVLVNAGGPAARGVDRSRIGRSVRSMAERMATYLRPAPAASPERWAPTPLSERVDVVAFGQTVARTGASSSSGSFGEVGAHD